MVYLVSNPLEIAVLKVLHDRYPHGYQTSKTKLAVEISRFFTKSDSVRVLFFNLGIWEKMLGAGIITQGSPAKIDRNVLYDVLNKGRALVLEKYGIKIKVETDIPFLPSSKIKD